MPALIEAIETKDFKKIEAAVNTVVSSLKEINDSMDRMPEFCDPYIYYNRVRPFIHGWKNNPSLPQGMLYEGVSTEAKFYRGETGAQSGIVPVLDAVFGITHADDPLRQYLLEMREYMPKEHRMFLEDVEKKLSLRSVLSSAPSTVKDGYNQVIYLIEQFRTTHLKYAVSYIANQAQTSSKNSTAVGTGGTPFVKYLTKHRDETSGHKV
jgi:indoleamine 2,3-dioxygenase